MDARRAAKRRLAALAAAFAAAAAVCLIETAGAAEIRVVAEPQRPEVQAASLPALPASLPSPLGSSAAGPSAAVPSLSQPPRAAAAAAAASSELDPRAADAPRPADASAGLKSVAASIQKENAQPAPEAAPSAASRAFFDGGLGKAVRVGAVLAAAGAPGGLGMPAAYALQKYAGERGSRPAPAPAPLRQRILEYVDPHAGLAAAGFVGLLARAFAGGTPLAMALLAAGVSFAGARGMEQLLAQSRREVVGGWQASHDQKYRVDPGTGRLKDVRGHKYGEDRYEEFEDGPVGAGERLWFRVAAAGMGALLLSSWSGPAALLFGASLAGLFAASDLVESLRPKAQRVRGDEDRAHAARFRR